VNNNGHNNDTITIYKSCRVLQINVMVMSKNCKLGRWSKYNLGALRVWIITVCKLGRWSKYN
jgi:hypothetical protein